MRGHWAPATDPRSCDRLGSEASRSIASVTLWLKARRARQIAASVAAAVIAIAGVGEIKISLPVFGELSGLQMPLALLAPVVLVLTLAAGLANGDPRVEAVASRRIALLDAVLVATATAALAVLCVVIQLVGFSTLGAAAARNAIGLAGILLLCRPLGMRVAAIVPVGFLVFVAAFGSDGTGNPDWWAWAVASGANSGSWAIAAALAAAGLLVAWRASPPLELGSE